MKSFMNRIALFAAGAVVFGTTAFGQTVHMTAQIPFAFHTAGVTLPAGAYAITMPGAEASIQAARLRSVATGRSIVDLGLPNDPWAAGTPALRFRCGSAGCALIAIRTSKGTTNYSSGQKKTAGEKEVAINAVVVRTANGD